MCKKIGHKDKLPESKHLRMKTEIILSLIPLWWFLHANLHTCADSRPLMYIHSCSALRHTHSVSLLPLVSIVGGIMLRSKSNLRLAWKWSAPITPPLLISLRLPPCISWVTCLFHADAEIDSRAHIRPPWCQSNSIKTQRRLALSQSIRQSDSSWLRRFDGLMHSCQKGLVLICDPLY